MRLQSLRSRLTLGIGLVLAIVLAASGLLVAGYSEDAERRSVDDRLERTAELSRATARQAVQEGVPDPDNRLDAVLDATRSSLRLLVGKTAVLDAGTPPPTRPAPVVGFRTFRSGGQPYRALTTTLQDESLGGIALLQLTTSLRGLERRQAALERRLTAFGVLALLVAMGGTWLAAGAVLRPLRRLREVTSSVADDEDLDRRVPADRGPREVRSVAGSFNAMLARLGRTSADRERALAATRRFAADAGHELRTPLTSVLATLSTLRRHPGLPEDRRTGMLDDALAEHRRLVDLLDGLQALARGDAAPPPQGEVDLADVAAAAVEAVRSRHPGVQFDVHLPDDPVCVTGWEPGLRLVIDNLLRNAAVHGRADGGHVRLALDGRTLVVEDDGPGIPEAERGRVFEPFARVDRADARPGSGLGLALVAQQVRHHGGTVTVDDGPLGGARFTVRF